jgi:hypothetical protein
MKIQNIRKVFSRELDEVYLRRRSVNIAFRAAVAPEIVIQSLAQPSLLDRRAGAFIA